MAVDTSRNLQAVISQYRPDSRELSLFESIQALLQTEWGDVINALALDIDTATNFQIDAIGQRLGYVRPPVPNTDLDYFGFAPEDLGFGAGVLATSDPTAGPTREIGDDRYRSMLKARGLLLRSNASRAAIEAELAQLVGAGNFRMTEPDAISFARTPQLVGLTTINGVPSGITANGRRYRINPIDGSYTRLMGDMPSRVYSSLAHAQGDLRVISGANYYPVTWSSNSVTLGAPVAITGLDASANISGPVEIDGVHYMATPTSLYTIDPDASSAATRVGAFAPATDIRGLTAVGKTLYACDNAGAVRTVDVSSAATESYHATGASSLACIADISGALFTASASRLYIVDTAIKANALSFSIDLAHESRVYLDAIARDAEFLISRPVGVGLNLRRHVL